MTEDLFATPFDYKEAIRFIEEDLGKKTGLPYDLYDYQKYALTESMKAFASGKYDDVIIVAPTGSGKSGIAVGFGMAAAAQEETTMFLTPTRQLQAQNVKSFSDLDILKSFKGKANYPCTIYHNHQKDEHHLADTAPCVDYDAVFNPLSGHRGKESFIEAPTITDHPAQDAETTKKALNFLSMGGQGMWSELKEMLPEKGDHDWNGGYQSKFCLEKGLCPYRVAREIAETSPIALLNLKSYFLWNTYAREAPYFKPRFFTVFDECHNIEDHARDFYAVTVTDRGLNELYKSVFGHDDDGKKWVDFTAGPAVPDQEFFKKLFRLNTAALLVSMEKHGLKDRFQDYAEMAEQSGEKSAASKLIKYHKVLKLSLDPKSNLAKSLTFPGTPAGDKKGVRNPLLEVVPVDLPQSFQDVYGTHNIFMSATIADAKVFAQSVCLDLARTKVIQLPDTFPVENRPIISLPIAAVNKESLDADGPRIYKALTDTLEEIAGSFPSHRILVHTSSYVFGQEILKYVESISMNFRILCPKNGTENKEMIAQYSDKTDEKPYILITPACREGYDFDGDLCRIQVFMKCPYPSIGDEVVSKKLKGPGGWAWYNAKTATGIRQQYGRSTRNKEDFSVTFFLDARLIAFVKKNSQLFPPEFHKAMLLGDKIDWRRLEITTHLSVDGEKISY